MFFKRNKSKNNRDDVCVEEGHSGEKKSDESGNGYSRPVISPHFEGFPYLVTRLAPAIYHISLFPDLPKERLEEIASRQFRFNRLDCCLVTGPEAGIYYRPSGKVENSRTIPAGGTLITGSLKLCCDTSKDSEMARRRLQLRHYITSRQQPGMLMGDLRKGGHSASESELGQLNGHQENGIPCGLEECPTCGEWHGECLDPDSIFTDLVVRASCRCENDNRCAACGELLADRKVNANYFDPKDGQVWHVPGFTALNHKCAQGT
jgi:hypothetical protein